MFGFWSLFQFLKRRNQPTLLTFVIEPVDPVNTGALVVATKEEKVFRILDLVCEEEADGLQGLLASIHIVAKKEVVGLGRKTPVLKESEEVRVLAVDVTWRDNCIQGQRKRRLSVCLSVYPAILPHIFRGASSSRRMGCCRKISRDLRHRPRTSDSLICTVFPGREPRTEKKITIGIQISLSSARCVQLTFQEPLDDVVDIDFGLRHTE